MITLEALHAAFDHFNRELFAGILPPCTIILRDRGDARGYHDRGRNIIAIAPRYIGVDDPGYTLSVLVHEMVHHYQARFGCCTNVPHNQEWAAMMESIGLPPSSTGAPGGERTGLASMRHWIDPDGAFWRVCRGFLEAYEEAA